MNTSRRSQVLRMHRRGERPEQIAAALGLPQNEVDLLLKLQRASQSA
jgi:DNA-binding NarL/FixJ family response regulator